MTTDPAQVARPDSLIPEPTRSPDDHGLRAYLVADIRGYTAFTHDRGDEAASVLVQRFVDTAASAVRAHRGRIVATWGDGLVGEFRSARDVIRAALSLQTSCVRATLVDPSTPLAVGVGLDAGEPAGPQEAQSGAALNHASRLAARAHAGEVLATPELVHLAGAQPEVRRQVLRPVTLKGLPQRVTVVRLSDDALARVERDAFRGVVEGPAMRRRRRRTVAGSIAASLLLILGATTWVIRQPAGPVRLADDGILVVDGHSGLALSARDVGRPVSSLATARQEVWATVPDGDVVTALSRTHDATRQFGDVTRPMAIAVDGASAWVAGGGESATVTQVSTKTGDVVQTVPVGNQPDAIAATSDAVWVATAGDARVERIDPTTGKVRGIDVGDHPAALAVGAGRVWVANARDNTVTAIDPTSGSTDDPIRVGAGPTALTIGWGAVWVANSLDLTVSRIDLATRAVTTVPVGDTPVGLAAIGNALWVANQADGSLSRIDPVHRTVTRTVALGAAPHALAVVGNRLWVAATPFAAGGRRGGTLRITGDVPSGVDPNGNPGPLQLMVYDGLMGLRRAPGSAGYEIVPDLAAAFPVVSDGGKSYTFRLRSGIHYSDGRLVQAADVRHGFERVFTTMQRGVGDPVTDWSRLVGEPACQLPKAKTCDLSRGITTDGYSVTFHLSAPDPDFIAKLTDSSLAVAPTGSPLGASNAIPGTGPYRVADFQLNTSLTLARNSHFHPWSSAAQPAGFPDRIEISAGDSARGVAAVEAGTSDLVELAGTGNYQGTRETIVESLRKRYPDRVKVDQTAIMKYIGLNSDRRPFSDPRARQALAFALDRKAIGSLWGYSDPACQVVPPDFPGYTATCPFTVVADRSGRWHAPDLDRARALVAASHTRGMPVEIYIIGESPWLDFANLMADAMRAIGYHPHITKFTYDTYGPAAQAKHPAFDADGAIWAGSFPDASTYYVPILGCGPAAFNKAAPLCNPLLDRRAAQATALQLTNPGRGQALWRSVFRDVTAQAEIIATNIVDEITFIGDRVGNYQSSAFWGPLYDQMWVQ